MRAYATPEAIGLLHVDDDNRPSLALDLAEQFRPLVVDQVVMEAIRRRRIGAQHGQPDPDRGGILLTRAGREALLDGYERRMLHMTRGALPDFAGSLRRHLYRQAQALAAWTEDIGPLPTGPVMALTVLVCYDCETVLRRPSRSDRATTGRAVPWS